MADLRYPDDLPSEVAQAAHDAVELARRDAERDPRAGTLNAHAMGPRPTQEETNARNREAAKINGESEAFWRAEGYRTMANGRRFYVGEGG